MYQPIFYNIKTLKYAPLKYTSQHILDLNFHISGEVWKPKQDYSLLDLADNDNLYYCLWKNINEYTDVI